MSAPAQRHQEKKRSILPICKQISKRTSKVTAPTSTRRIWGISLVRERGQGMVEYAFILVLIAMVVIVMLITTGGQVRNMYSDITYTLHNQAGI
jgi:Flp pilus assembly pilin Flp